MTTTPPTPDRHHPVLLRRVVELLSPALRRPGSVFLDATLGLGGHTETLLRACPDASAVGIDRDRQALRLATARLAPFGDRFTPVHAVYDEIAAIAAEHAAAGTDGVQAVLFDLGVSSLQLDEVGRGFAYRVDAPLDMRMDQGAGADVATGAGSDQGPGLSPQDDSRPGLTAADVLNTYAERDLARILREYGEERFARRIAAAVVRARRRTPFTTSGPLVELLREAIPAASQRSGGHPAKRTFQALRIEVNEELAVLERAIPAALSAVAVQGRVAVLSYHSLEDRMTKRFFSAGTRSTTPVGLPVELAGHAPYLRSLTRGAEQAPPEEVAANPRAASVRLRAVEKIATMKGTTA